MKEFTGLKINGMYELKDEAIQASIDIQISKVSPVELMTILSALVVNVLKGADEKNAPLFLHMFSSVFDKFVEESVEGVSNE
ncbi:hypothetical protein [Veillonella sp. VA139]|uniref:hypothetical protein n=1 Tax=Veillonella sp. VA139 TaxID=741830 RepID=UPI000F8C6206|nr:hypothetical protein [Veillonella sp. VA139]